MSTFATRQQDELAAHMAARFGRSRVMRLDDERVIVFGMSEETTYARYVVDPRGAARPATDRDIRAAHDRLLAHVRIPCDACGYPARRPRCARCGNRIGAGQ